jgi:multidrug efflux system membrane fusion protein
MSNRVLVVPLNAVVRSLDNPNGFAVFVPEGSGDTAKVRMVDVELGSAYGNVIAVMRGLHPGNRVVTTGATMIKTGEEVQVIP